MLNYKDLDPNKKAFIFELDNVLYPEKDYLLQVYYLFSNFIESIEAFLPASDLTDFFRNSYNNHGDEGIFNRVKKTFGIDEKYRINFERLYSTARLPLKLLLFEDVLKLLQEIVIDRKQIFLVLNGDPAIERNKIIQIEWNGLEEFLKVYYAREIKLKPEPDVLSYILKEHNLIRKDVVIIGATETDEEFAIACGVDYYNIGEFM